MPLAPPTMPIRVLCVDDHSLVRKGISSIVANETDIKLVAEAANGRDAVALFRQHQPDVTLMDLRMPELDGIEASRLIRREYPEAKIIALTSFDGDQDIYRALEAGVRGYLLKEMVHTEVLNAIRVVHSGQRLLPPEVAERLSGYFPQVALTPREVEVLYLGRQGAGEQGDRLAPRHGQRHRQDAHPEHPGEAGRHGSNARRDDRPGPRHHPLVESANR